jgi:metal-responsive CopG/Arc/MetJ family transcriptional regulator
MDGRMDRRDKLVVISVKLPVELVDDLWVIMKYTKMNRSEIIREALKKYIEELKEKYGLKLNLKKTYLTIET